MKKIITFALALALAVMCNLQFAISDAQASGGFVEFPTLGRCTGTGVNLRDAPNTKNSSVLGSAQKGNLFVVLGERRVGKDIWYEIENPAPDGMWEGSLWISGKYLTPAWRGSDQQTLTARMIIDVLQKFGSTPERSIYLLGRAYRESDEDRDSSNEDDDRVLVWGEWLRLVYRDNFLIDLTSYRTGVDLYDQSFMGIELGTPSAMVERVTRGFTKGANYYVSNIDNTEGGQDGIRFFINDGVVHGMGYNHVGGY